MTDLLIVTSTDLIKPRKKVSKYPWRSLEIGKSFIIPNDGSVKFKTIEDSCYKWSKKLNRIFRAANHGEHGIEVGRLE